MSIQPPTNDAALSISLIEQRLIQLREEYESGQRQMSALEQRTRELRETMLRISGAIAALEEMLEDKKGGAA
jgi:prefoldin subunit 5